MALPFREVCDVKLGFKSFLNDFFYVDIETIRRFGIENDFLIPLMKLSDLVGDSYVQTVKPQRWLFACSLGPNDLRGTGAARYIEWGSVQETRNRKQTEKSVRWSEAPALSHSKYWYWPAAPVHPAHLAIRKGIGSRYAPFIFKEARVLDQRLYLLFPRQGVDLDVVAAYMASSLFPLAVETNADMGPGAGVLTLGTDSLRGLPVADLRAITSTHKKPIKEAFDALVKTVPPHAEAYSQSEAIRALDEVFLAAMGQSPTRAPELEAQVAALAGARITKSKLRTTVRVATRRQDVERVAGVIVDQVRRWVAARRFPEDYFESSGVDVNLPTGPLTARTERLLGTCHVEISRAHTVLYANTLGLEQAEVLLRSLQLGRRSFHIPQDDGEALRVLEQLDTYLDEFESQLDAAIAHTGLGIRHENTVRDIVMADVSVPLGDLREDFDSREWVIR